MIDNYGDDDGFVSDFNLNGKCQSIIFLNFSNIGEEKASGGARGLPLDVEYSVRDMNTSSLPDLITTDEVGQRGSRAGLFKIAPLQNQGLDRASVLS